MSQFPQFSVHLTIYGSVKDGNIHNEMTDNVVTYRLQFPFPKKVNKRDPLRGCWDRECVFGRDYMYKRKKPKHYDIVYNALKDIDR